MFNRTSNLLFRQLISLQMKRDKNQGKAFRLYLNITALQKNHTLLNTPTLDCHFPLKWADSCEGILNIQFNFDSEHTSTLQTIYSKDIWETYHDMFGPATTMN